MSLAILEGLALFLAVVGSISAWGHLLLVDWLDVLTLLLQAAAVSVCCIVAFYYNDLYDLRIVRSFSEFGSRLLQSFVVALILLAAFYMLFPDTRIADGPFVSSLLMIAGILLPLRAVGYTIMRRRALSDRVLVLGTGQLARNIIAEIDARPHYRYAIAGVVEEGDVVKEPDLSHPLLRGPARRLRGRGARLAWRRPIASGRRCDQVPRSRR